MQKNELTGTNDLTKHLRVILNAWHSQLKWSFVFMAQEVRLSGSVAHTLMRR
ncbi:hypothetical protein XM69_c11755 [Vibrio parahaemolyticus]|nr:hypothetical protein XM69_c11755 [Vibrio parahaemolyticus]